MRKSGAALVETCLVGPRSPSCRAGHRRRPVVVRADRQGRRRSADGAVRHVRRLRDAGHRRVRRHEKRQAHRAHRPRDHREPGADHRHAGQRHHLARRGRHGTGGVRDLLRRDRGPERRLRLHGRHVRVCAAGGLRRGRVDDPEPARRLVAGLGGRHDRGAAAVSPAAGRPAARGDRGPRRRARQPPQRRRRRRDHRPGVHARGQGEAADRVPGRAVPAVRAGDRRPGPVQPRAAAPMGSIAGQRRLRRPRQHEDDPPRRPCAAARRGDIVHRHPRPADRARGGSGYRGPRASTGRLRGVAARPVRPRGGT